MFKGIFHGASRDSGEAFTKPSIQARASACGITKLHGGSNSNQQRTIKETA
jgi:hypothetical protein